MILDIVHKKVKLDVDQIVIHKKVIQTNTRDNESQSTKLNDVTYEIPLTTDSQNTIPLDHEAEDLLRYSKHYGLQILCRIIDSATFIDRLCNHSLGLEKTLMIYFLNNVRVQSLSLHDLVYREAANLDKDIRLAAMECMSKFKIIDEQEILNLIRKPKDSLELLTNHKKGLLISLLEDQYQQIRISTIKTIINFNKQSNAFATLVLDILITMLNDEADMVRIEAVQGLLSYPRIEFNQSDSNAVKFNLNEQNFKLRKAIYDLIGQAVFPESLLEIFESICLNLHRFPQDFIYIAKSIRQLALKNLNMLLIPDIIKRERLQQEPNIYQESQEYVIRMIYAFHTQRRETDPFYFQKHFAYLSDKYPDLFQSNKVSPTEFEALKLYDRYQQLMNEVFNLLRFYRLEEANSVYAELCAKFEFENIVPPPKVFNYEFRLPNWGLVKFKSRSFKFLLPLDHSNLKVYSEFPCTFNVQGEFTNLKQPIGTTYAFKVQYMDGTSELTKIYNIEDNIIKGTIELSKKIQDFSQPAQVQFVQSTDGLQIGNSINIYLQI